MIQLVVTLPAGLQPICNPVRRFLTFGAHAQRGLQIPSTKRRPCLSLLKDQEVVTDPKTILEMWEDHFRVLSSTNSGQSTATYSSEDEVETLMLNSLDNEDYLFDVPFVAEEVDSVLSVLKKLKLG